MARVNSLLHGFNRGIVSKYGLARVDVDKLRLSAEVQTNWTPSKLGPMSLRPGLGYIGATKGNSPIETIPFIASLDEMNLLELGSGVMRVRDVTDDTLVTRVAVPTIVKSLRVASSFTTSSAGGGSASQANGVLTLTGAGHGGWAKAKQTITVKSSYANTEHAIRIVVLRGPVLCRIGSTDEGEQYLKETSLFAGVHSLAFVPKQSGTNNSIYLQFESRDTPSRKISSVTIEGAGSLELPIHWDANDLPNLRYAQSADVMFMACAGKKPQRIERRSARSWSVVDYDTYDGPFHIQPTSNISLAPSATEGNITLTASRAMFKAGHAGTLIRLFQNGQLQSTSLGGANQFCQPVRVTGTHAELQNAHLTNRTFEYQISDKGGEEIKNGNFAKQSDWTGLGTDIDGHNLPWQYGTAKIGTKTVTAAVCDNSASTSTFSLTQPATVSPATAYTVTFNIVAKGTTGTGLLFYVGGTVNSGSVLQNKLGVNTLSITTGGSVSQAIEIKAGAGWKGAITNVSIKPTTVTPWVGMISMQRSIDGPDAGFTTVKTFSNGTPGANKWAQYNDSFDDNSGTQNENFDNVIAWYRLGFETGNYTSGSATVSVRYGPGSGAGIVKINSITDSTHAVGEVVHGSEPTSLFPALMTTAATFEWLEGEFSDNQVWPTSVALFEGRLWFGAKDKMYGSVSDAYNSYDYDKEGDAAPIIRSIGEGPVQGISGLVGLQRLVALGALSELSVRSSAFDEPLTPTNFSLKQCSTIGSYSTQPLKIDSRAIYINRSQRRLYELAFSGQTQDYESHDLTSFVPNLGNSNFQRIAVQRQPDTRIHVVRADGTVACLLFEPDEQTLAWFEIKTTGAAGFIERVAVLPGNIEDQVYYVVRRTVNGANVRYIEKFARMDQCVGATLNYQADSFKVISQASSTTITGLAHLEGRSVVVWANGKDLGTYSVSSARITGVSEAVTSAIVGLTYTADYTSAKLAYGAQAGTAINQEKRITHVGFVLADTHYQGLTCGPDTSNLTALPLNEDGTETPSDTIWSEYDQPTFAINGDWDTDSRLCLRAAAPRPCTVCASTIGIETHEA